MKTLTAALLTVGALSVKIYPGAVDKLDYYKDLVTRDTNRFNFTRLVPVTLDSDKESQDLDFYAHLRAIGGEKYLEVPAVFN